MSETPIQPHRTESNRSWPTYRTVWRWHFYAGVFCIPFVIVLAVTGTIYLFRPQIEAWQEREFDRITPSAGTSSYAAQVSAAVSAIDGGKLANVEAVSEPAHVVGHVSATRVIVEGDTGEKIRIYVDPQTETVLGKVVEDERFIRVVRKIHGELLLGNRGSYLVETAASWTIVMVITGMVLWMPPKFRAAGIVFPRLGSSGKVFWKDIHSVGGFWASILILFLVATGLPWSTFWGDYFKKVRRFTGTAVVKEHVHEHWESGHENPKPARSPWRSSAPEPDTYSIEQLDDAITYAKTLGWLPPVIVHPPSDNSDTWKIESTTANRPHRQSLMYDVAKGEVIGRETFANEHWVDQLVGQGIALHEGQRWNQHSLGWINQALALIATTGLVMLSVTGVVLWIRRRDGNGLSPPPRRSSGATDRTDANFSVARSLVVVLTMTILAVYLPLFGLTALVVVVLDAVIFSRNQTTKTFLGRL